MDFYLVLKKCYKKGIAPFELYSVMSDLCCGDLKLKREIDYFYTIFKQGDIVEQVNSCNKEQFDLLYSKHDKQFANILTSIAQFQHPEWGLECPSESVTGKRVKVQKFTFYTDSSLKIKPTKQGAPKAQKVVKVKQNCNKVKCQQKTASEKKSIYISSLISNVEIITGLGMADFEIRTSQNGKSKTINNGILQRQDCIYINVENLIADKILIIIPKNKYKTIKIDKIHGDLTITDVNNCFGEMIVNLNSGNLKCCTSSKITTFNVVAGEVLMEYNSITTGRVDIINRIGGVKLFLYNVKRANFNLMSNWGQGINRFKPGKLNGNDLEVKIKSKYGDIEVF